MKRFLLSLGLALGPLAFAPSQAMAGFVFYDDFNDRDLLPHWSVPPASDWEYNLSNSMLNVTALLQPSDPKIGVNFAGMGASFTGPQTDFVMDAWMGWEAGDPPHRLELRVNAGLAGGGAIIAIFQYRNQFAGDPVIIASASGQAMTMPAPPPGIHHFTIARTGTQFNFFLNGSPFATFADNFGSPAASVGLLFAGPYPGELGAFHVDRIQVIPAAGFGVFLVFGLAIKTRARRRVCAADAT